MLCLLSVLPFSVRAELNPLLEKMSKYDAVKVEKVLSVDKLLLVSGERVVLIGIQGPRPPAFKDVKRDKHGFIVVDEGDPTTSIEEEAMRAAKELLDGQTVRLEFDVDRRNEDGALLAYVFLSDGRMANLEFLREGYADLKLRSPNFKYADQFRAAYRDARRDMKGLQGQW
jgi:micrococcal nuclease